MKQRYVYYVETRWERGHSRAVYRSKRSMLRWVEWALGTRHLDSQARGELIIGRIPKEQYDATPAERVDG